MDFKMTRRQFARGVSAASMGAAAAKLGCSDRPLAREMAPFAHAGSPIAVPIDGRDGTSLKDRISLNVYSFNIALNSFIQGRDPAKNFEVALIDLIRFCQENGIPAIDPTGYYWWNSTTRRGYPLVPSKADIDAFRDEAQKSGIAISGTGIQNNFASPYPEQRASDLLQVRAWCDVAAELGAPILRVFAGPVPPGYAWDEIAKWMADCLAQCAEYGKAAGVKIGVQNHGDMLKTADQAIQILRMVDSEWLGAINDTGYFLTPDPYDDIARLLPYTITFQVKESVRAVKNYQAAWTSLLQLVGIIKASGYPGWLPVETLATVDPDDPYDPRTAVPAFVGALRDAIDGVMTSDAGG